MSTVPSHAGLYSNISESYNSSMLTATRRYVATAKKLARWEQHLTFNHRCKQYNIIPKSLKVRPLVDNQKGRQTACQASRQFLAARISKTASTISHLKHDMFFQKRQLEHALHPSHFEALEHLSNNTRVRESEIRKSNQKKKFDRLRATSNIIGRPKPVSDRWIVNRFSGALTDAEKSVLAPRKRPKLCPSPKEDPNPTDHCCS